MEPIKMTRREAGTRLLGLAAAAALGGSVLELAGCGAPSSKSGSGSSNPSAIPAKPKSPQTLSILDIAGNLQLTQGMLDDFRTQHGDIVNKISTATATAPELAGKLKAQEDAGRLSIDLVLTGTDGLSAGIAQNLLLKLTPDYNDRLTNMQNYLDPAAKMQELAEGYGVELVYYPSGPLLEYDPATVPTPPTSTDELLAWAKANPGKFQYAEPENSGPGRTFLMGLPYLLGDSDPKDPTNGWDKTWAYLAELGKYAGNYESGTTATMKNLANGTSSIIASTTGWDINPRVLGTVPNTVKIQTLQGWHWIDDAQFAVVPRGIDNDKLSAILNLLQFMLTPKEQAIAYDKGYFYPGPAIKGVTLDMAPASSQQALAQYGRPEYDQLIASAPNETSLPADAQVTAFKLWDEKIGATKQ